MKRDITEAIERMPVFEDRTGTRIEALFGEIEETEAEYDVHVRGEIHANSSQKLSESIDLVLGVYDSDGRMLATTSTWLSDESFFAFEVFDLSCYGLSVNPARVRIWPKFS